MKIFLPRADICIFEKNNVSITELNEGLKSACDNYVD